LKSAKTATGGNGAVDHEEGWVATCALDVEAIRRDFPILRQTANDKPLVYLDNAATAHKPTCVIDAISGFYRTHNANIHRGVHTLSVLATDEYEKARRTVQRHLGAADWREIVFVRGATEGINLVATAYGVGAVGAGDEIIVSAMEHHSNIVPWQMLCKQVGAVLRVIPMDDSGALRLDEFARLLGARTKIVAVAHVSNSLGTINPIKEIVVLAHAAGAKVLVDGAQAIPHMAVDVRALDCDFYVFSSHKTFGPTGVGALYAKHDLLEAMQPYQGGGEMIRTVTFDETTYNDVPFRFEAGTPHIAGAIGLASALTYLQEIGLDRIRAYEAQLLEYATRRIRAIDGVRLLGTAEPKAAVISFLVDGVHAHDVGTILDQQGVAVRTGHHCTQPVMEHFGVEATTRASLAMYNTHAEIDTLVASISHVLEMFS